MKIIGINISHDCSVAFFENKKIINFFEEERLNGIKKFNPEKNSFLISLDEKLNFKPDLVCYASYGRHGKDDLKIIKKIQKQIDYPNYYFNKYDHHIYHCCSGFYFSNFEEAMAIVIDGSGAFDKDEIGYCETQSIFYINKKRIVKKYQHMSNRIFCLSDPLIFNYSKFSLKKFKDGTEYLYSSDSTGGHSFNIACSSIGMNEGKDAGKLMGLSSYAYCSEKYELDYNKVNIAKEVQEKTFNETCFLIEKAFNYKKIKNFVLSGGFFQNCSNNFKYVKKYPELNFFVDPVSTDAGTAIGVCIYYENYL